MMKDRIFNLAFVALFALALAMPAFAGDLTEERIKGFVATLSELDELADRYDDLDELEDIGEESQDAAEGGDFNPMTMAVQEMRGHEIYDEFSAIVSEHGFSDPEDWASTGDRIVRAMMALEMERQGHGDMRAEMDEAMREMEQNPNITDEQRQQMRQQMEQAVSGMEAMADAPQEDIDAVKPHADELRRAMED